MTRQLNRILLQTTIGPEADDWNMGRLSLIQQHLESLTDEDGQPLYAITARNREWDADGNDPTLSKLDRDSFDELWLFAVDTGSGLNDIKHYVGNLARRLAPVS